MRSDLLCTNNKLIVFGDSHSAIWEGRNLALNSKEKYFKDILVYHLGPALAYNLMCESNLLPGKWGLEIISILDRLTLENIEPAAIILCFGEIDIRTRIISYAINFNITIEESCKEVSSRICKFAEILYRKLNVPILIWEPVATSGINKFIFSPQFPAVGSEIERNFATQIFSEQLKEFSKRIQIRGLKVYSFGIYYRISCCFHTLDFFFDDGCHLNFHGIKYAIDEIRSLSDSLGLDLKKYLDETPSLHTNSTSLDIATFIKILKLPIKRNFLKRIFFNRSAIFFDIGYSTIVCAIKINNIDFNTRISDISLTYIEANDPDLKSSNPIKIYGQIEGNSLIFKVSTNRAVRYISLETRSKKIYFQNNMSIYVKSFQLSPQSYPKNIIDYNKFVKLDFN